MHTWCPFSNGCRRRLQRPPAADLGLQEGAAGLLALAHGGPAEVVHPHGLAGVGGEEGGAQRDVADVAAGRSPSTRLGPPDSAAVSVSPLARQDFLSRSLSICFLESAASAGEHRCNPCPQPLSTIIPLSLATLHASYARCA